jgi:hypothetical protein
VVEMIDSDIVKVTGGQLTDKAILRRFASRHASS